ncbi:MAG: hypothetical protein HQL20_00955 [Candidatus Omnitrophica bacterium]|nr:hypothetical protein [Candidatus Omnitrophota bacterium]
MSRTFNVSIVTPERSLFEGPAVYLAVPGGEGNMGILPDHAPLLSTLLPGQFEIRLDEVAAKPLFFKTQKPGFIEVNKNIVSILLDAADSFALAQ